MLSIGRMGGGQSRYYLDLAAQDYYLDGGEPLGKWWGRGADKLKLSGTVERRDMERVFAGFTPDGDPMVQNAGKKSHRPGFDLTFSAPKSVSVLWSQADPEMRQKIQEAHHAAVLSALSYFQDEAAFSRRGKGGLERVAAAILVATFEHGTSRALDPQLHTHALVMNVAFGNDGRTGTLDAQMLYRLKMTLGAIYRADFSASLSRLGFECEQKRTWFELKHVPEAVIEWFSKRRADIIEELGPENLESASAAAIATLETRGVKGVVPPRGELFARWQAEAAEYGLSADMISRLFAPARDAFFPANAADLVHQAAELITESESHFTQHELVKTAALLAQGRGVSALDITAHVKEQLANPSKFVSLGERAGERRYTTVENYALEKEMLAGVDRLAAARTHGVQRSKVESVLAAHGHERSAFAQEIKHHVKQLVAVARGRRTGEHIDRRQLRKAAKITLTPEQAKAVRELTSNRRGSIRLLSGHAGTGKTTTLAVAREIFERGGYTVHGVTLSGKARKELQKGSGIQSDTLAMLDIKMNPSTPYRFKHHAKQLVRAARKKKTYGIKPFRIDKNTVLVVDEAGMLATRHLARLVKAVEKGGGIIILVGDKAQLQPLNAGGPFASLCDRLIHSVLTNVTRQRDQKDRDAAKAIREGQSEKALKHLGDTGRLVVAADKKTALAKLVSEWATKEARRPADALIFAGTNADANELNRLCQETRRALGLIDPRRRIKINETYVHVGDRVLLTKTDRKLDLNNGETATVTHINTLLGRVTVKVDGGARIVIPLRDYKHQHGDKRGQVGVSLGYAVTTHKGQGTTVERAYVLAGGSMQDREISYVQLSRARGETRVYTHDPTTLVSLSRQMNESRAKDLAHDVTRDARLQELAAAAKPDQVHEQRV